jgi:hypothetical protein
VASPGGDAGKLAAQQGQQRDMASGLGVWMPDL